MKAIQKVIIIAYGILVTVACIYVPWRITDYLGVWYSLIWNPVLKAKKDWVVVATIDFRQIILEIIIITVVTLTLFILTSSVSQKRIIQRITQRIFTQKTIIIAYFIAVLTVFIYVPWIINTSNTYYFGYSLFWDPPSYNKLYAAIDFKIVILEIIAITAVFGVLFVLTLRPKQKEEGFKNLNENTIKKEGGLGMKKLTILDKYATHHMIFFVLGLLSIISIILEALIVTEISTGFFNIWITIVILTLIFLIVNIIDTIKVFRIIAPTPLQFRITWFMCAGLGLLTLFAGFYVNGLIKNYKKNIS
jgi:hypothetical protein